MHCFYGAIYNNLCPSKKIQNTMDLYRLVFFIIIIILYDYSRLYYLEILVFVI
jgi:hypothetical protein